MKEPMVLGRADVLSLEQAQYWKDLLYRTVKIGTEIEFALPKGMNKDQFLPQLIELSQPTHDVGTLGRYGVLDVESEHCGIEMRILGRQPYYPALISQYREIVALLPDDIRTRPTCGLHYHLLTVGLTEPVPEVILANIWNLTRRYAPELRFLTSAGEEMDGLCRRRNHTSHLELIRHTPTGRSMKEIKQVLHDSRTVPEHQNFLNLEHLTFASDGSITTFHLEFRFPDADISPTSIVAKTFLFLALLLKAVEMSQYGLIHSGQIEAFRRKVELLHMLSNNDGPLATSDTSLVTPEVIEELRVGCRELLELLKPVFDRFEHNPSYEVLSLLAETPISLLRSSGRSWKEIEEILSERATTPFGELDKTDQNLMRCIELVEVTGATATEVWKWNIARELFLTPHELETRLEKLQRWRGLRWDERLGAMVFAS